MKTIHDFGLLVGWQTLKSRLDVLGIRRSLPALERMRRRYRLPYRGRPTSGRAVCFSRADVDCWVRHLVGMGLDEWVAMTPSERQAHLCDPTLRIRLRSSRSRTVELALPTPLYAILERGRGHSEQVWLQKDGMVTAELIHTNWLEPLPHGGDWWRELTYYRYDHARLSTPSDRRAPVRRKQIKNPPATALVGAFVPGTRGYRRAAIPGEFLGLEKGTQSWFLASKWLPRFEEAIRWLRKNYPDVYFVTWTRRVSVKPVTFEEWSDEAIDLLKIAESHGSNAFDSEVPDDWA